MNVVQVGNELNEIKQTAHVWIRGCDVTLLSFLPLSSEWTVWTVQKLKAYAS